MPGSRVRVPPLLFSEPPGGPAASGFPVFARKIRDRRTALLLIAVLGCSTAQARVPAAEHVPQQGSSDSVVVLAAGDLVCGTMTPNGIPCFHPRTAALVKRLQPNALLLLGDLQYETGSRDDFAAFYDPAFGEFKSITYPTPGNHEYMTPGASGYYDYFNGVGADSGRAGSRRRGYYSFNLGAWHIVALNSNCLEISGGCGARSPQANWLRADLAAHKAKCTLVFTHSARFSSGEHGNDEMLRDLWQVSYDGGVDVFLSGHEHIYERFSPQDARGRSDGARGIRAFIVGTGGKGTGRILREKPNSEIQGNRAIGVLSMTLRAEDYSWRFEPVAGLEGELEDSGSAACHE